MIIKQSLLVSSAMVLVFAIDPVSAQSSTETYTYDALGRLIVSDTSGGQNDDEVHSICYDKAGNRVEYTSKSDGSTSSCVDDGSGSGGGGTPPPPPPPPPPPTNNPPSTTNDLASGQCLTTATVNLTVNDTDPEGNYPLALTAISSGSSGQAFATIVSGSSVSVDFGAQTGVTTFTYTVADSLGATSTGQLEVWTSSCGGGGEPF